MEATVKEIKKLSYSELSKVFQIHPFIIKILLERTPMTYHQLYDFFYGDFYTMSSPFIFESMRKIVAKIQKGIQSKKKFYIVGDKDVDGTTAISIFKIFFQKMGIEIFYNLPLNEESYGFSERIYQDILEHQDEIECVITVDCGIKEVDFIDLLNKRGIETIITDHHKPLENKTPGTEYIINPHFYEKEFLPLCGGGLALKVVLAVYMSFTQYYNKPILWVHLMKENKYSVAWSNDLFDSLHQEKLEISMGDIWEIISSKEIQTVICFNFETQNSLTSLKEKKSELKLLHCESLYYQYTKQKLDIPTIFKKLNIFHHPENSLRSLLLAVRKMIYQYTLCLEEKMSPFLELASVATICDRVALNHRVNRSILKSGIQYLLDKNHFSPLQLLFYQSSLYFDIEKSIAIQLGSCLNAPGRLGKAYLTVEFLTSRTLKDAEEKHSLIKNLNQERQKRQKIAFKEILTYFELYPEKQESDILFYASETVSQGVTGILANNLNKTFHKPAIIIALNKEKKIGIGSGRALDYSIHDILEKKQDLFFAFGGHDKACGFTLPLDQLTSFQNFIEQFPLQKLSEQEIYHLEKQKIYDFPLNEVDSSLVESLEKIAPFGEAHKKPLFKAQMSVESVMIFGKEQNHLKIKSIENPHLDIILWRQVEAYESFTKNNDPIQVIYDLSFNVLNRRINVVIQDWSFSGEIL